MRPAKRATKLTWRKPEIIVAIIAGLAVVVAAIVTVSPQLLDRSRHSPSPAQVPSLSVSGTSNPQAVQQGGIRVEHSPGAVVQNVANSPNSVQVGIGSLTVTQTDSATARWRLLLMEDIPVLTNKLIKIPKTQIEVVSGTTDEGSYFADQIAYFCRASGFDAGRRTIVGAGSAIPPGLSIIDNRPAANRVEVADQIKAAFGSIGIQMEDAQRNNEADRPMVFIFVGAR